MTDLSIEMDTHQLERVIEKLDAYDPEKDKNFYIGMGRRAKDEVPRIASKLKSFLNISKQINLLSGRINNTARVVLSGDTLKTLSEILEKLPNENVG